MVKLLHKMLKMLNTFFSNPVKNLKVPEFDEVKPFAYKTSHLILNAISKYSRIPRMQVSLLWLMSQMGEHLNFQVLVIMMYLGIVTRNNIVWKLARGYYLCYCNTFSLAPDSRVHNIFFSPKSVAHYLHHLKSNNIIGQSKTTNTEKHFYPWLASFNLKLSCR